ncbi:MAG TPA: hypothetical protein DDZ68_09145 [Parvularcula sp.]|nr:hypothetical protein [Parvularcula sp.]
MSQAQLSLNFFVEFTVALIVVVAFVLSAALTIKERHRDVAQWHVLVGAGIYGALFGAVIGFVIVPLRALVTDASLPPQYAAFGGLTFIAIMLALRSGIIMRLPFLGPQVKAWRRASLRRAIENAARQIDRLGGPRPPQPKM